MLFLPQYHPEYNAIEYGWSFVKGFVRRNPPKTMKDLLTNVLPQAYDALTPDKAKNICNHVLKKYLKDLQKIELERIGNEKDIIEAERGSDDESEESEMIEITTIK